MEIVNRLVAQCQSIRLSSGNLKLAGDSMQVMMLIHSNIAFLMWIVTDDIVEIPRFDDIDESFSCKRFLVPQNSESECPTCKRNYDYFAIWIASRLKNSLQDAYVFSPKTKEVRSELYLREKSSD